MRWTTWTSFFVAVALLLAVGGMVSRQSSVTPEEFFESVEKRIADGRYDREQTLQNLDQVLARAREAGDVDLESRVLLRRGRIAMELGAWDRARTDLLAVAERRPGDAEIEADLIELETSAGDFAAAEARVRRGLELDPRSASGWTRLGRLHRLAAEKQENAAIELLARVLPQDDLEEARAPLSQAIALDPADVARPGLAQRLRNVLRDTDEETLQAVLRISDRAAEQSLKARDAYARSLEIEVTPEPLAALLTLFSRAGRDDLAADLGGATLRFPLARDDLAVARAYFAALERLGRYRFAGDLARPWLQRQVALDAEFLEMIARIGLYADKPEVLVSAGRLMFGVGNTDQVIAGRFFHGLALVRLGDDLNGRNVLRGFVGSSTPDPIPGARARAWRAIAKASRTLGEPETEREALQGAIELEPDFDGEQHLRMAELLMAAPHGGYRLPELRFAKGISLLPLRTAELLPRWHEIGRLELASIGFDPEAVRTDLLRQSIWNPAPDASPYELYRLAEIHHAAGDAARARSHLQRLLEIVPGFLPAIDLAIEVARTEPTRTRLIALVAQRVEAGGRTPETTAILREVPLDELDPRDLHELMRADPEYFGRIAVARTLAAAGRPHSALTLLESIDPDKFGDEARVLAARLQLEAGQPARTWELLEPMARTLMTVPGALELAVRAASWSGSAAEARGLVGLVAGENRLNRQRRLGIADIALRAGLVPPARRLLEAIDSIPESRGGDVCVALAVAAALDDDADAAKRALARGEAFETKGALERAALVVAIRAGRTNDWRALAERASSRSSTLDALGQTALLVLRGRDDEARTRIAELREKAAESGRALDARWSVLARSIPPDATSGPLAVDPRLGVLAAREIDAFVAGFDAGADPRAAAAWVFESAVPEGFAHAAAAMRGRIAAAPPGSPALLWPTWSLASLDQASGDVAAARAGLAAVAAQAPDFRPAWDLREVLEPELRLDPVAYGRFRGERERALGANAGTPTEIAQDRARALAAAGDHAGAIAIVVAHAVTTPTSGELAAIAGRSQLALGKPRGAIARFAHALSAKPPPIDERGAIAGLLEAVDAAARLPEPLPRTEAAEVLSRLAALHENDPRLVLALANIDLQFDPRNPVLGVQRALARLDRYRALHRDEGLDAHELGSAAAWIDFVARLDPARAIALAASELDLAPGSIATWLAAARAHEAAGDEERALTELQLAARVADRGEVSREILRLRSGSDLEGADVVAAIARVQALENRPVPDPALRLLAARAYANIGARLAPQALELARSAGNDPTATAAEKRGAALLASLAILSRVGVDQDLSEPARLLEGLEPERPSRLDQDFLRALRGVAAAAAPPIAAQ